MAADADEADRDFIAQNMDADLQFILSETGVSIHRQAGTASDIMAQKNSTVGNDRAQIRTACPRTLQGRSCRSLDS